MSTTKKVSDFELGRMAHLLVGRRQYGRVSYYRYVDAGPVWTRAEVASALNISVEKLKRILAEYDRLRAYKSWTSTEMADALMRFVLKNGRWPVRRELRRKNDLPSEWSLDRQNTVTWRRVLRHSRFKSLPPKCVLTIPNLTVRRDAIDKYDVKKLMKEAKFVQQDDFGKLWRLPYRDGLDASMLYVEVENKTVNPDGTTDHYYLRVPPDTRTAREAVAWTFNIPHTGTFAFAAES